MNPICSAIEETAMNGSGVELPRWIPMAVFDMLQTELTDIIGPIAQIVIEEDAKKIGYDLECFPEEKFGKLIERLLANLTPYPDKRNQFQQQVEKLI